MKKKSSNQGTGMLPLLIIDEGLIEKGHSHWINWERMNNGSLTY
ncbi:hypothetical protein ACWV26_05585 [Rummeliibacillus sp. JY-2-4R]